MPYKLLITSLLLFNSCNAGIIGSAIGAAKDKAVDKTKETTVDIYKQRKEIRRENEKITGKKSLLSKTEDRIDSVKSTAKNSIGKENIEYLQKGQTQMKNTLIGKSIN